MDWYYEQAGRPLGPINDQELLDLMRRGRVRADDLVWREGMDDWAPAAKARSELEPDAEPWRVCAECRRMRPEEDLFPFQEYYICGECKPRFLQKLQQGAPVAGQTMYAGFWIRAGAKVIDYMILGAVQSGLSFLLSALGESVNELFLLVTLNVIQFGLAAAYSTFFLGRYGATIGKMACRLKVVSPEGRPIGYLRALGRYFAEILSGLILGIGYLMVAWDEEKRALHDRICGTRVIRTEM